VAAAAKKTRKELLKEPDEFITLSSRMVGFIAAYKKTIAYVCFGVLLAVVAVSGYVGYSGWQESKAAAQLAQALAKYERLSAESSQGQAVPQVAEDFKRILNDYGNRSNGNTARVLYANLCYETGDFKQAVELYQTSLARFQDDPLMRFLLLKCLAYAHEGLKDYAAAAGYFEQALSAAQKNLQDDVLFHLGDLYARLGDSQKSTAAFNRLLTDHQDSIYVSMARERVNS
jgi:predicted negative regulator of RcsB-dependent stress response